MADHELLIAESCRENRTTHAPFDATLAESLLVECDDYQDEQSGLDASDQPTFARKFWGTTDDGVEWSVTLDDAPAARA